MFDNITYSREYLDGQHYTFFLGQYAHGCSSRVGTTPNIYTYRLLYWWNANVYHVHYSNNLMEIQHKLDRGNPLPLSGELVKYRLDWDERQQVAKILVALEDDLIPHRGHTIGSHWYPCTGDHLEPADLFTVNQKFNQLVLGRGSVNGYALMMEQQLRTQQR